VYNYFYDLLLIDPFACLVRLAQDAYQLSKISYLVFEDSVREKIVCHSSWIQLQ
jgi:hypothetical protein